MARLCYGLAMSNKDITRFSKRYSLRFPWDVSDGIAKMQADQNLDATTIVVRLLRRAIDDCKKNYAKGKAA